MYNFRVKAQEVQEKHERNVEILDQMDGILNFISWKIREQGGDIPKKQLSEMTVDEFIYICATNGVKCFGTY